MDGKKISESKPVEILIVEDSPTQAEQLKYILDHAGYSNLVANNGKEAMSLLNRYTPNIIITDIIMPEMDGYQLCKQIKIDEKFKDIPVILLTALSSPEDVVRGLECGADHFITKPYEEKYLLSHLKYVLSNRELRGTRKMEMGVELAIAGQKYFITSDRMQILNFLISTYEAAMHKNDELLSARDELKRLNEQLEEKVKERTAALMEEIEERKRVEKALRESEKKYRTLFEESKDAVYISTPEGKLLDINTAGVELYGYSSKEELLKVDVAKDLYLNPEDREKFIQLMQEQGFVKDFEVTERRKDGKKLILLITGTTVRNGEGNIIAYRGILRDITNQRNLEEQLLQAQKMEAIGQLTGGIAHDFNNLLTVIRGYSQLSITKLKEDDPLRVNIERIENAAEKASVLINQLLAFGRRQVMEMKIIDLNAMLKDLETMLHRLISEDIELIMTLSKDLGMAKADPGQIEQVIFNLVVNSKDAMPCGGKLTIETTNIKLDETYTRFHLGISPGDYVMISVSDNGIGMTPEVKERIFEPFFTTKEKGKGTGLGLSTVYGIVKQSGGHIWVYSEPGHGTTFKIYLPRVDEPLEIYEKKSFNKEIPSGNETILVVEDDSAIRELISIILKMKGYGVLEASYYSDALAICEKHLDHIHLLLTDIIMPEMSGLELADRITSSCSEIKVLYMSGYTNDAIIHHGVLEKGMSFIQKPFTPEALLRKVREVLDAPQEIKSFHPLLPSPIKGEEIR